MRIGAKLPNSGDLPALLGVGAMAAALEDAGFESLWVGDHAVGLVESASPYPYSAGSQRWNTAEEPWYDALIAMTLASAATARCEIGVGVLVLPLRHPVMLAKQLASLDRQAKGRVVLGVGSGWNREEFEVFGCRFRNPGKPSRRGHRRPAGLLVRQTASETRRLLPASRRGDLSTDTVPGRPHPDRRHEPSGSPTRWTSGRRVVRRPERRRPGSRRTTRWNRRDAACGRDGTWPASRPSDRAAHHTIRAPSLATMTQVTVANTATTLSATPTRSTFGELVVLTATVRSACPGTITGAVTFFDGDQTLGVAPLDPAAEARLAAVTLPAGDHALSAVYSGDTHFAGSSAATNHPVGRAATSTVLTGSVADDDPPMPAS